MPLRSFALIQFAALTASLAAFAGLISTQARAADAPSSVEIHAFGDAGFIGGYSVFALPPKNWVESQLGGVESLRADVNFLNLEGALTRSCQRFVDKEFSFAIAPEALAAFYEWGFNLVSLANNHSQDCLDPPPAKELGPALAAVHKLAPGLAAHGVAPTSAKLAGNIAILTIKGVRIGMVAIKAWENGRRALVGNLSGRAALMRALQEADVDIRILSMHGGLENTRQPTDTLMDVAREFVGKYGGDIVFAHHPHRAQGLELLAKPDGRAAVVFYSLGNFLHNGLSPLGDGMMAKVAVTRQGIDPDSIGAFPLLDSSARPGPAGLREAKDFGHMLRLSNAAIAQKPLPSGLTRWSFSLKPTPTPTPGLALVPAPLEAKLAKKTGH